MKYLFSYQQMLQFTTILDILKYKYTRRDGDDLCEIVVNPGSPTKNFAIKTIAVRIISNSVMPLAISIVDERPNVN